MQRPRQGTLQAATTRAIAALLQEHHEPTEMSETGAVIGTENASAKGNGNANGERRKSANGRASEIDWRRGGSESESESEREAGKEIGRRSAMPILAASGAGVESLAGRGSARANGARAGMAMSLVDLGGMMPMSGQGAALQRRQRRLRTADEAHHLSLAWRAAVKGKTGPRGASQFKRGWRRIVV